MRGKKPSRPPNLRQRRKDWDAEKRERPDAVVGRGVMLRPQWLINIVAIKAKEGIDHSLTTDEGDHRVQNGTLIALVNPDLTEADRKRLNDLINSGAFMAVFFPKEGP